MIEFHADDYGMFPESSRRIIKCINEGCINGISLMANSENLDACMEIYEKECRKEAAFSVHLNIMTERPLSEASEIPDLTDSEGFFNVTYGRLFKACFIPELKKRYKAEIKKELRLQLLRCRSYFTGGRPLRIDSHRHFHMVPLVFDAISEIIEEESLDVSYIRTIFERPEFYRGIARFECFRPVNVIKVLLLNGFSLINRVKHRELYMRGRKNFTSILFSGSMTPGNLGLILKNIENNPSLKGEDTEIMMHPGAVFEKEDLDRIRDPEDRAYMCDPMRNKEAAAAFKYKEYARAV